MNRHKHKDLMIAPLQRQLRSKFISVPVASAGLIDFDQKEELNENFLDIAPNGCK
jgi:hypothetical protein